jgi:hypothetical protein
MEQEENKSSEVTIKIESVELNLSDGSLLIINSSELVKWKDILKNNGITVINTKVHLEQEQNKLEPLKAEHQLFVDELFKNNLNQVKAYLAVYPNASYDAARSSASFLITKHNIQNAIEKKFNSIQQQNNISVGEIISDLKTLIDKCKVDDDRRNFLKALDQLSKLVGAYAPQKVEHTNQQPLQINIIAPDISYQTGTSYKDITDIEPEV